jgi:hypothetical protein
MENGTSKRLTISAIAFIVLIPLFQGFLSSSAEYASKATGADALPYRLWGLGMAKLSSITTSLPFLLIAAGAIAVAIFVWSDYVWRRWRERWGLKDRLSFRAPDRKLIAMSLMLIFGSGFALSALWVAGERFLGGASVVTVKSEEPGDTSAANKKIADLGSQLETAKSQIAATRAELDAKKKEFESVQLTPEAEKDVKQSRLRFRLERTKIDKEDFDKAIAGVRGSAEGALNLAKQWGTNPPLNPVGNMPLRQERVWEENTRALQKVCDRVFPEEKYIVTPSDPTLRELTYPVPGDTEVNDPDTKQRFRILSVRIRNQENTLKQVEQKIQNELTNLTNQMREMR